MTKLYVIRHAEAEGNIYRRIHGHYDSRITSNGLRQIRALERRFAAVPIDAVYASDLNRAMLTLGGRPLRLSGDLCARADRSLLPRYGALADPGGGVL